MVPVIGHRKLIFEFVPGEFSVLGTDDMFPMRVHQKGELFLEKSRLYPKMRIRQGNNSSICLGCTQNCGKLRKSEGNKS